MRINSYSSIFKCLLITMKYIDPQLLKWIRDACGLIVTNTKVLGAGQGIDVNQQT